MVYILLTFFLFALFILNWKKDNILCFWITALALFVLLVFRSYNVGADTLNYVNYFLEKQRYYSIQDSRNLEIGFEYYLRLLRFVWKDGTFFLFVNAIVTLSAPLFYIRKYSRFRALSLLLFVIFPANLYFLHFIALRQMIASSMVLWAYYFYKEKGSIVLYVIFSLIAVSFHTTAIIVVFVFFLAEKVRIARKFAYFMILGTYIIGISGVLSFSEVLGWVFSLFPDSPLARISGYVEWRGVAVNMKFLTFLTYFCLLVFYYVEDEYINDGVLKLLLIGVMLTNLFSGFPMLGRFSSYFLFFSVIAITYSWVRSLRQVRTLLFLIVIFYFIGSTINTMVYFDISNETKLLPYSFVF